MDFLDEVQDIERLAVEQGRAQGVWDAKNGDMHDAGVQSGILKGYPLGLELGFMQALQQDLSDLVVKTQAEEEQRNKEGEEDGAKPGVVLNQEVPDEAIESMQGAEFNGRPKDAIKSIGSRVEKRREVLAKRLAEIPVDNSNDIDFDTELESLRALYRSCNPAAGKFIRDGSVVKEKTTKAW